MASFRAQKCTVEEYKKYCEAYPSFFKFVKKEGGPPLNSRYLDSFVYFVPIDVGITKFNRGGGRSYYNNLVEFKGTLHQKLTLSVPLPKFPKGRFREDR